MADKRALREFLERLYKDRPEELERLLRALDDERFSCTDWMEQEGYSHEQCFRVLRFSGDVLQMTVDRTSKPVKEWTAKDWEEYEVFEWDCTAIFRELLQGYFTQEQVNEIAEAWEHDRYVHRSISDGYGRMHHCRFCTNTAN